MTLKKKTNKKIYDIKELKKITDPMVLKDSAVKVRVYKSGNSNVVTIPSHFPFKIGDEFSVVADKDNLILKKVKKQKTKKEEQLELLNKFIGSHNTPMLKGMSIKELEEYLEGIYER